MKQIAVIAVVALSLVHTSAHAWFFFIPGSVTSAIADKITGAEGDNCVGPNTKVGDRINVPGRPPAIVKSLSGTSIRCTAAGYPIRALLDFDAASVPAPVAAPLVVERRQTEGFRCVAPNTRIGADFVEENGDRGLVKAITRNSSECVADATTRALIVFDPTSATKQQIDDLAKADLAPASAPALDQGTKNVSTSEPQNTPSARLRALSKLLDEGLITTDDYNTKKREILGAM